MKILQNLLLTFFLLAAHSVAYSQDQNQPVSQAEMEQILAPIALYPDTVLSHILVASTYPLEVIQAERWTASNSGVQGSEAVEAVNDENWDPSVKALVAFPQILKRLSEDLDWTQRLGDAFLQDEQGLLASVQILRQRAYKAGSLDGMEKVSVTHNDDSIVIEPRERQVIYLPYYDSRYVYGPWSWSHYPPIYWDYPYYNNHYAGHYDNRFYWGPRINISFGFYFSSFNWRNHHLVRISHNHYRPNNYYNHNQIINHQYASRWSHNPTHRRSVPYRTAFIDKKHSKPTNTFTRSTSRSANAINQSVARSINARSTAPTIRRDLRNNRVNIQQRTNRSVNLNQNRTINTAVRQATTNRSINRPIVSRPTVQNARQTNNVRATTSPAQPTARATTPIYTNQVKPVVQRSVPKSVASPRQQSKPQNNKANVRKQAQTSKRNGVRRNPR